MNKEDLLKYVMKYGKLPEDSNFSDAVSEIKQHSITTGKRLHEYFNVEHGNSKVLQGSKFKLRAGKYRR